MAPSIQPFNFFDTSAESVATHPDAKPVLLALAREVVHAQNRCTAEVQQRTSNGMHQVLAMREAVDGTKPLDIDIPGRLMPIGQKATAVIYDTETGDLAARKVVEWASVKLEIEQQAGDSNRGSVHMRLWPPLLLHLPKPDVMSPRAATINHYNDECFEQLGERGAIKSWPEAASLIVDELASADLAVAHNTHFDHHALVLSLREEGLVSEAQRLDHLLQSKWACTSSMAWACLRQWRQNYFDDNRALLGEQGLKRLSSYQAYHDNHHPVPFLGTNLGKLYQVFFDRPLDNAHSAAADVYGASAIFLRLLAEGVNPYLIFKERHDSFSDTETVPAPTGSNRRERSPSDAEDTVDKRKRQKLGAKKIPPSEVNNALIGEELKKFVVKLADHDRRHIIAKSEIEAFIQKAVETLGFETVKATLQSIPGYQDYERALRDPALEQFAESKGLVDFSRPEIMNKRLFLPIMWIRFNLFVGSGPENRLAGRLMHAMRTGSADKRGSVRLQSHDAMLEEITEHPVRHHAQRLALVDSVDAWIGALKHCLPDQNDRDMASDYLGYSQTGDRPSDNLDETLSVADRMRESLSEIRQAARQELCALAQKPRDAQALKKAGRAWVKNLYDSVSLDLSQARVPGIRQLQHERLLPLYQKIHQHIDAYTLDPATMTTQALTEVVTALYALDREAVRWGQAHPQEINNSFETPVRPLTVSDLSQTDPAVLREAGRAYGRMIGVDAGPRVIEQAEADERPESDVDDWDENPIWHRISSTLDGFLSRFGVGR